MAKYRQTALRQRQTRRKKIIVGLLLVSAAFAMTFLITRVSNLPLPTSVTAAGVSAGAAVASAIVALATFTGTQFRESQRLRISKREKVKKNFDAIVENLVVSHQKYGCPIVKEVIDPTRIGVSRSLLDSAGNRADATYVRREVHREMIESLREFDFVLVIGDSKSGKSRMAFECIRELFPTRIFLSPVNGATARSLTTQDISLEHTVIWLDDLERFLTADGLDQTSINKYLSTPNCSIVATIRSAAHAELAPESTQQETTEWRIVQRARSVRLSRILTNEERTRLPNELAGILDRNTSLGLAEYLSGAIDLLDRYRDAEEVHPAGWALTRAAIELVRCGLHQPLPAMIQDAAAKLLPTTAEEVDYEKAWKWALEPIYGSSALLAKREVGVRPFDYLLEKSTQPIPPAVWDIAQLVSTPVELASVGFAAFINQQFDLTKSLQRKIISMTGGQQKARAHYELAICEIISGNRAEAIKNAKISDDLGYDLAPHLIGDILMKRKRRREAEKYFNRALDRGIAPAAYQLAKLASWREDSTKEVEYLNQGSAAGDPDCVMRLAEMKQENGATEEAEILLKELANKGHLAATAKLGDLKLASKNYAEALYWYESAAAKGGRNFPLDAGLVNEMMNKSKAAEEWYQKAVDHNPRQAHLYLGCLYVKLRRHREAIELLEPLADHYSIAVDRLSIAYLNQRRLDDARILLERAALLNMPGSRHRLGELHESQGDFEAASLWYQRAANTGDRHCMAHLGMLSIRAGKIDTAKKWILRANEDSSDPFARQVLHFFRILTLLHSNSTFLKMITSRAATKIARKILVRKLRRVSTSSPSRLKLWLFEMQERNMGNLKEVEWPNKIQRRAA